MNYTYLKDTGSITYLIPMNIKQNNRTCIDILIALNLIIIILMEFT